MMPRRGVVGNGSAGSAVSVSLPDRRSSAMPRATGETVGGIVSIIISSSPSSASTSLSRIWMSRPFRRPSSFTSIQSLLMPGKLVGSKFFSSTKSATPSLPVTEIAPCASERVLALPAKLKPVLVSGAPRPMLFGMPRFTGELARFTDWKINEVSMAI